MLNYISVVYLWKQEYRLWWLLDFTIHMSCCMEYNWLMVSAATPWEPSLHQRQGHASYKLLSATDCAWLQCQSRPTPESSRTSMGIFGSGFPLGFPVEQHSPSVFFLPSLSFLSSSDFPCSLRLLPPCGTPSLLSSTGISINLLQVCHLGIPLTGTWTDAWIDMLLRLSKLCYSKCRQLWLHLQHTALESSF